MAEIVAYFQTASGAPLTGPAGANIPEVTIVRTPADTVAQAAIDMVELTNAPGWYQFTFATVDGEEYVWIADGDPAASGQLPATGRYVRGAISGTTVERSEVDVPAILTDTAAMQPLVDVATSTRAAPGDAMTLTAGERTAIDSVLSAAHGAGNWDAVGSDAAVLAAIAALNDLSITDVQTALDNQGYTSARALLLDNLDAAISTRATPADVTTAETNILAAIAALNDLSVADVTAIVAPVLTAISLLNDLSQTDVQAAMTTQGYTSARALLLDNLDVAVSSRESGADAATRETNVLAAIAALENISIADVQTALTTQGYTTARAAELSETLDWVKNRRRIDFTVTPRQFVLYDRTGLVELFRADLTTFGGEAVGTVPGSQIERGQPA